MNQEVLLVASSAEGTNITAWDVHTGTALTTYKTNACPPNGITLLGADYMIATQLGKPALHAWTWHKDQVHIRSFPPEPITALAASRDGAFIAAGGASGAVHVWEAGSGRLLRSWPVHYKKVTALAFSDSGGELVTGGEDTLVTAWLLAEALDIGASAAAIALGGPSSAPLHSWSDHTLPVAAVAVGAGGAGALVFSVAADRTLKIRELGSGAVLRSVALPAPLTALAVDPGEHSVYAGSAHGTIFDVSLVGQISNSDVVSGSGSDEREYVPLEGHSQAVTSLAVSSDGARLVSGCEDGGVMVWDLRSRQPVRTLAAPAKGPVAATMLLQRPEHMPAGVATGRKGPQRMAPLAQLSKYPGQAGSLKPWEGPVVLLDGSAGRHEEQGGAAVVAVAVQGAQGVVGDAAGVGAGASDELEALRAENAKLKEQAERAMALAQQWGAQNADLQKQLAERA